MTCIARTQHSHEEIEQPHPGHMFCPLAPGAMGDCWLIAAIAAVAEFPNYVRDQLFCGTSELTEARARRHGSGRSVARETRPLPETWNCRSFGLVGLWHVVALWLLNSARTGSTISACSIIRLTTGGLSRSMIAFPAKHDAGSGRSRPPFLSSCAVERHTCHFWRSSAFGQQV